MENDGDVFQSVDDVHARDDHALPVDNDSHPRRIWASRVVQAILLLVALDQDDRRPHFLDGSHEVRRVPVVIEERCA